MVGRVACVAAEVDFSTGAVGPAASAVPARGEAMVATAARAAVSTDRRINAEAIWVLRSSLVRPTTQRRCAQMVTAPVIAPARPRVEAFAARPPIPASDFGLFTRFWRAFGPPTTSH